MKKVVKLVHLGIWYKAYGDDAKIVSFITGFKLFEDIRTLQPCIGFPEYSIEKVVDYLARNKINYQLINDDNKIHDYGKENNYEKFLHHDLPFSYIVAGQEIRKRPYGKFKVKYEDEPEEEYVIGENINENAELVQKVCVSNIGDVMKINDFKIELIDKEIEYK